VAPRFLEKLWALPSNNVPSHTDIVLVLILPSRYDDVCVNQPVTTKWGEILETETVVKMYQI